MSGSFPLLSCRRSSASSTRSELSLQQKDPPGTGKKVQVHPASSLKPGSGSLLQQLGVHSHRLSLWQASSPRSLCLAPSAKARAAAARGAVAVSTLRVPGWYKCRCRTTRPTDLHKAGRKEGELARVPVLSKGEWSLHLRFELVAQCEKLGTGEEVSKTGDLSCSQFFCPSPKRRFPWRTARSPQNSQVVSWENFGTGWSLCFNFRWCFLFSLGLVSIFSSDTAMLIQFSKQVVKNVEGKNPSPALRFYFAQLWRQAHTTHFCHHCYISSTTSRNEDIKPRKAISHWWRLRLC